VKILDLFSGIGGFTLAAKAVWGDELETVCFVENDPDCQDWPVATNQGRGIMRGCRGSDPNRSADYYQVSQRVGRSGRTVDEIIKYREWVNKQKKLLKKKGACKGCRFFGVPYRPEMAETWGADYSKDMESRCILLAGDNQWSENCPCARKGGA